MRVPVVGILGDRIRFGWCPMVRSPYEFPRDTLALASLKRLEEKLAMVN